MSTTPHTRHPQYGLMAEFHTAEELIEAVHKVHEAGFEHVDAFTPYPIEEVAHALDLPRSKMPLIVLGGGITGGLAGYMLQYWSQVLEYPMNIGGRPFHAWPAFIVPTFEMTILFAALAAVLGMFALNGLPQPYHPVFNWSRFERASQDSFFLAIESTDPKFDANAIRLLLTSLRAKEVVAVEN
jgi:hypothetical protein